MEELQVIEYSNQRVLTTQQLAEVYETSVDNIKMNFSRNKERFVEGKHYHMLKGDELRAFKNKVTDSYSVPRNVNALILWTEKGADRHCKILDTDKAWEQFDNLEDTYFKVKEMFELPKTLPDALRKLADEVELNEHLKIENKAKDEQIGELQPKAEYCEIILQTKDCLTASQIAKDYGYSATFLNRLLHDLGVQYKVNNQWLLYSQYSDLGYTESDTSYKEDRCGVSHSYTTTKWTQKGRMFIYNLLKEHGYLPLCERV